jgi:3-oxoacyl-[acyl-carrier protein] reductase
LQGVANPTKTAYESERTPLSELSSLPLHGKTALVTGASQGIGRAIAKLLAAQGAVVALAARNIEKLAAVAAEIEAAGGRAHAYALDVSDEVSIRETAKTILAAHGRVDLLVNNAGITRDGLMMRMKRADWEDVLNTNLTGTFLLTQALLSPMTRNRWGRIVNIASVVGQTGQAGQVNYASSKAALLGFTRSLARELASRSITVNAVAPGFIETAMTGALTEEQKKAMLGNVPLARAGNEDEVAHAVVFLCSEGAAYITGHTLDVNGGLFMQ